MAEEPEDLTLDELHERCQSPETTPVAVRLPEPLLADLDDIWTERGYNSRSEFVRDVLREAVENPDLVERSEDPW